MLLREDPTLTHHTSAEAAQHMDELCDAYADAYGAVPGEDTREKSEAAVGLCVPIVRSLR